MECEREFLIEASCGALQIMRAQPCLGEWKAWSFWKPLGLPWSTGWVCWHFSLRRRVLRVMECQYYSQFSLWMLHAYKNNKCYYFVQVRALQEIDEKMSEVFGKPVWIETFDKPMPCFFVGSYPLYWVREWQGFGYANDTKWGTRWALTTEPFIPGVDMGLFRDIAPERWDIYLKKEVIAEYRAQLKALQALKTWQEDCKRKNYDPEPEKPPTIKTPRGPGTMDIPISQITPPPLETIPPEKMLFPPYRMTIDISQKDYQTIVAVITYPATLYKKE